MTKPDLARRSLLTSAGMCTLAAMLPGLSLAQPSSGNDGKGRNPVLPPGMHIPDPEGHVMPDGRLYVYGSWDRHDDTYCSNQYRVFSTPNLRDWSDHGVSFDSVQVPWMGQPATYPGVDWSKPTPFMRKMLEEAKKDPNFKPPVFPKEMLFAPDCIHHQGRYYLYFCMPDGSEGVAVGDSPQGPFHRPVQLPCGGIDPAVFIDRDGSAYFYWGQFFSHGARLTPSMTDFVPGSEISNLVTEEQHFFHEGSSMRRRGNTYYYVYASVERGKPTTLSYATSTSPLGPFTHRGIIIDNAACDPKSWNNHGSIEEVDGQWYVFYHRSSRSSQYHRRLCIEPITFRDDGSIIEAKMTSQGAGEPFRAGETIPAWRACEVLGGAWIGPGIDGREVLAVSGDRNEALFRYIAFDRQPKRVNFSGVGEGQVEVYLNESMAPIGRCHITNGRGTASLKDVASGRHALRLVFRLPRGLRLHSVQFS